MSDKERELLCEWMNVIEKRLKRLEAADEKYVDNNRRRGNRLDRLQCPVQSPDEAAERRLSALEGDAPELAPDTVAVPVATLRIIEARARAARSWVARSPFSRARARANIDMLLATIDRLWQPPVRIELNPEAGGEAAISEEMRRMGAES